MASIDIGIEIAREEERVGAARARIVKVRMAGQPTKDADGAETWPRLDFISYWRELKTLPAKEMPWTQTARPTLRPGLYWPA